MGQPDDNRSPKRRLRTASSALAAILAAFALGILFNAPAMVKTAEELPYGGERDARLAVIRPIAWLSHGLRMDRPAVYISQVLGRTDMASGSTETPSIAPRPSPSSSSAEAPLAPAERPLAKPTKRRPLRLYMAGDSLLGIPGTALVNASRRTHLIKPRLEYKISTGLARPDFFDWPARVQRQLAEFRPGAVVFMFGGNDNQAIQSPGGKVYQFGTSGWKAEYRSRVRQMLALLADGNVQRVYWVGLPPMSDPNFDRETDLMNEIFRSEANRHAGVTFIDGDLVLSANGRYEQYLKNKQGRTEQVREGDGVHMTYAGGTRLSDLVLKAIKAEWLSSSGS